MWHVLQLWRNLQIPKTDSSSKRQRWVPYDPRRKQSRSGTTETSKSKLLAETWTHWLTNGHPFWSSDEITSGSLQESHLHAFESRSKPSSCRKLQQDVSERRKRVAVETSVSGGEEGWREKGVWWNDEFFSCQCRLPAPLPAVNPHFPPMVNRSITGSYWCFILTNIKSYKLVMAFYLFSF